MTRDIFIPELLNGIDEELIAESERYMRGVKTTARNGKKSRFAAILIAATFLVLALAAVGIYYLTDGFIFPPDVSGDNSSEDIPPDSIFVIENGILISYSGSDTEVTVPEGVTSISATAFEGNSSMKVLTLSSTVTVIENGCLSACEALEEVRVADGGAIGSSEGLVFSADGKSIIYVNKAELSEHLVIPEGIESIDASFSECKNLLTLTLPLSLSEIPERAFEFCESLESISLGGVRIIGKEAFFSCFKLKSADLGEARTVGNSAFAYCYALCEIKMTYVGTIRERAFMNCGFTEIDFGKRLKNIEQLAFSGCDDLSKIIIPKTLEGVYNNAFRGCGIKTVTYEGSYDEWIAAKVQFPGIIALRDYELIFLDEDPEYVATNQQFISNGDGTCTVKPSRNKEESGVITIPSVSPNGDTVTSVAGFSGCDNMTAIILPETVTSIGNAAFSGCDILERVEAPGAVTLGNRAFSGCKVLRTVILSPSLTLIPESAFIECTSLTELPLWEGIVSIGKTAFWGTGAVEVIFPSTLTEVGESAFAECHELTRVDMSKSSVATLDQTFTFCAKLGDVVFSPKTKTIGRSAFEFCTALSNVTLPEGLETIGGSAFSATSLTSIVIPDSVTTLYSAFGNNESFKSITLGKGVKTLQCFGYCTGIESFVIPETITAIGDVAFQGCTNLREVIIPDSVKKIGGNAFEGCVSLRTLSLPDGITTIASGAFSGCSALEEIKLPAGLTTLDNHAFVLCTSLKRIELPASVRVIGESCFSSCTALEEIIMPKKVERFGKYVFSDCSSLKSIDLPEGITELGEQIFYNCTSLKSITLPLTLKKIGWRCFESCTSLEALNCPKSLEEIANDAFNTCSALKTVKFNEGLRIISSYSFANCTSLESVRIPASLENLNDCFPNCTSLKTVTFAAGAVCIFSTPFNGCTSIETVIFEDPSKLDLNWGSFQNFTALKTVRIEKGTLMVRESTFRGCTSLSDIDFSKLSQIDPGAFWGCTSLPTEIELSDSVTFIGAGAFEGCTSIEKVTCSPYILQISDRAFAGCTSLREISIGIGTSIGGKAFKDCAALETVKYPGNESEYSKLVRIGSDNEAYTQISVTYLDSLPLPKGYRAARRNVGFSVEVTPGHLVFDPVALTCGEECNVGLDKEGYLVAENGKKAIIIMYGSYYLIDRSVITELP